MACINHLLVSGEAYWDASASSVECRLRHIHVNSASTLITRIETCAFPLASDGFTRVYPAPEPASESNRGVNGYT